MQVDERNPMTPKWLEKIENSFDTVGELNTEKTIALGAHELDKLLYNQWEDMKALLSHIHKLREALDATNEMSEAWDKGPGTIFRPCLNGCPRPLPSDYKRDLCDHCLRQKALLHNPMNGGE